MRRAKKLPTLCPQTYDTMMRVETCSRCSMWDKTANRCSVETGCEHLPLVSADEVPDCPIKARCQHSIQASGLCPVRARGLVCVSALVEGGMSYDDAMDADNSFHADFFEPELRDSEWR